MTTAALLAYNDRSTALTHTTREENDCLLGGKSESPTTRFPKSQRCCWHASKSPATRSDAAQPESMPRSIADLKGEYQTAIHRLTSQCGQLNHRYQPHIRWNRKRMLEKPPTLHDRHVLGEQCTPTVPVRDSAFSEDLNVVNLLMLEEI